MASPPVRLVTPVEQLSYFKTFVQVLDDDVYVGTRSPRDLGAFTTGRISFGPTSGTEIGSRSRHTGADRSIVRSRIERHIENARMVADHQFAHPK